MLGVEIYSEGRADRTSTRIHVGQELERRGEQGGLYGGNVVSFLSRDTWQGGP